MSAADVGQAVENVGLGAVKGAVEGAAITAGVAEGVTIATGVAVVAAGMAGSAAAVGTAIGVGAAIGNLIPIPGIGAAIGAVIGALVALGEALDAAFTDTFHVSPEQAEAWLTVFRLNPCLLFMGVDKAFTPDQAARLVRYFKIVSTEVPTGKKGNTGELYNPVSNDSCSNAYMCQVDPDDSLTDPAHLQQYSVQCSRAGADAGKWFDAGSWPYTIAGRVAARMAGKTITDGSSYWLVNSDGTVTATTGPADPLPSAPAMSGQSPVSITDVTGETYTGRPLLGSKPTGSSKTGVTSSGVGAGWIGRPSVLVPAVPSGALNVSTQGWVTANGANESTTGNAPIYKAGTLVEADQNPSRVQQYGAYNATKGWLRLHIPGTGQNDAYSWFWVPKNYVTWNPTGPDHLWQMQLDHEGSPMAISTPAQAKSVLTVLRSTLGSSAIGGWSEFDKGSVAYDVKLVRRLAGESGPDPILTPLLGDVTIAPLPSPPVVPSPASVMTAPAPVPTTASNVPYSAAPTATSTATSTSAADDMWMDVAGIAVAGIALGSLLVAFWRREKEADHASG